MANIDNINTVNLIIHSATHYSFESDGSVALSGPQGNAWVLEDGMVHPASSEAGTNGYPAYQVPEHLERAKEQARKLLGLLPLVEKFGRMAEHARVEVPNGTECPDFRDAYYFINSDEVYNAGYRSGGTWVEGWWA